MIDILTEPKGEIYAALLKFAATRCETFSLVWSSADIAREIETSLALEEFLILQKQTNRWPGARRGGSKSTLQQFKITPRSLGILGKTEGLYSWLRPQYPEDLAFYLPNGEYWLASVAHEEMAWIEDDRLNLADLIKAVPGLKATVRGEKTKKNDEKVAFLYALNRHFHARVAVEMFRGIKGKFMNVLRLAID